MKNLEGAACVGVVHLIVTMIDAIIERGKNCDVLGGR